MNPNPYESKYPGAGKIPQANPSDGGAAGIGSDSLGTQVRDWSIAPILAQIQTHGSGASYSFREMFITSVGTVSVRTNGIVGSAASSPAIEVNGVTSVNSGTVVQLWPFHGAYPTWSFVSPGGSANIATTCRTVAISVQCVSGNLMVTYDVVRVVAEACT